MPYFASQSNIKDLFEKLYLWQQKNKKSIARILQLLVFIGMTLVFYHQFQTIFHHKHWNDWLAIDLRSHWYLLLLSILLMPCNWLLEICRWNINSKRTALYQWKNQWKLIWKSLSISFFLPNRLGEYSSRLFLVEKSERPRSAEALFLSSISQWSVIGWLCLSACLWAQRNRVPEVFILLSLISLLFCLFIWHAKNWKPGLLWLHNWLLELQINHLTASDFFKSFMLTLLRNLVFILQFYLLLLILIPELTVKDAYIIISILFFCQSFFPVLPASGLMIRGSLSLWITGIYFEGAAQLTAYQMGFLSSSLLLWFINVLVPACMGSFFFLNFKK